MNPCDFVMKMPDILLQIIDRLFGKKKQKKLGIIFQTLKSIMKRLS